MTPTEIKYVEKLKELIDNLTWQLVSPIPTTKRSKDKFQTMEDYETKLREEIEELGKQCQFELLCNPDIFEASANEHFEQQIEAEEKLYCGKCLHCGKEINPSFDPFQPIELTDEDIEVWADKEFGDSMIIPEQAAIAGAKAVINGEIKHIDNGKP